MFPVRDIFLDTVKSFLFSWTGLIFLLLVLGRISFDLFIRRSFKRGSRFYYRSEIIRFFKAKGNLEEVRAYYSKPAMSWMEQGLYYRLVKALPDHMVLAQVQLTRILGVREGYPYWVYYNRINQMSVDFVVCRKDGSVLAVIELDDSTHEREDRKVADAKKDKALASAGIRVIRWQVNSLPSVEMIGFYFLPDTIDPAFQKAPLAPSD